VNNTTNHEIRKKLALIRNSLIHLIHDDSRNHRIAPIDRWEIEHFIEKMEPPIGPNSVPLLMKEFMNSCCSYGPLRKWLSNKIGEKSVASTIHKSLTSIYDEVAFLEEENWNPKSLIEIGEGINKERQYSFTSAHPKYYERVLGVLITGSYKILSELDNGLEHFYLRLSRVNNQSPDKMWKFAKEFSAPIYQVGIAQISDFLKNIGCTQFVKVDYHVTKEFPEITTFSCKKMSKKEIFKKSIELSEEIGMTPFYLDKLLYQWGQYKTLM